MTTDVPNPISVSGEAKIGKILTTTPTTYKNTNFTGRVSSAIYITYVDAL